MEGRKEGFTVESIAGGFGKSKNLAFLKKLGPPYRKSGNPGTIQLYIAKQSTASPG